MIITRCEKVEVANRIFFCRVLYALLAFVG